MIGFSCINCGHTFSVQDEYEGQRIKCPKCNYVGLVVDDSGRIKIVCKKCGNENNVPENFAGKVVQCPKCNNPVVVSLKKESDENIDDYVLEKISDKSEKPKISDKNLIIMISVAVAFIVIAQIITAIVTTSYKSRKSRKTPLSQRQRQILNTRQNEQNEKSTDEKPLRLRDALKWDMKTIIICVLAISCLIFLFCRMYWCPECRKMWALKKINPLIQFGSINEYTCKYCGHRKRIY